MKGWKKQLLPVLCFLFLVGLTGCGNGQNQFGQQAVPGSQEDREMTESLAEAVLTFIHVGKGDAFLLFVPYDGYYMIDTGKKKDFEEIQEILQEKGVTELKGIFLSHGHKDHAGGLEQVLEEYPVERVYLSAFEDPSFQKVDARAVAEKAQVPVEELRKGDVLTLGEEAMSVQIQVLGPEQLDEENENNNSLILRMVYGNTAFLLMGDTELESEERLLASETEVSAEVLKLGHHGKMDATSKELLERVQPTYGIVTANREKEPQSGDPAMEERLREAQVQMFYSEGKTRGVDFISDGERVWVREY